MKARWIGDNIANWDKLSEPGDIAVGAENYHHGFMVNCPCCSNLHVVGIPGSDGYNLIWSWDQTTLTLSPSVRTEYKGADRECVCHWTLTNGEFTIHGDSTMKLFQI